MGKVPRLLALSNLNPELATMLPFTAEPSKTGSTLLRLLISPLQIMVVSQLRWFLLTVRLSMLELTTPSSLMFAVLWLRTSRLHTKESLMSLVVSSDNHLHSSTTEDSKMLLLPLPPKPLPLTPPTLPSKLNGSSTFTSNQTQELKLSFLLTWSLNFKMPLLLLLSIVLLKPISVHLLSQLPPLLKLPLLGMPSQLVLPVINLLSSLVP